MSSFAIRAVVRVSFVCALAVYGLANSTVVPTTTRGPEDGAAAPAPGSGYVTLLWSALEDCYFDVDSTELITLCLKSKALTALNRALSESNGTTVDGVARAGKSLLVDVDQKSDREAMNVTRDSEHKNDLLDDMIATRLYRLVFNRPATEGQEGRKKKDKELQQALMLAGMTVAAMMGPMALKILALIAGKALLISKIALVLSGLIALKKLVQPEQNGHKISHETVSYHHGRNVRTDETQDVAYSAQKQ